MGLIGSLENCCYAVSALQQFSDRKRGAMVSDECGVNLIHALLRRV